MCFSSEFEMFIFVFDSAWLSLWLLIVSAELLVSFETLTLEASSSKSKAIVNINLVCVFFLIYLRQSHSALFIRIYSL